ncbi:hypothetical protein HPB48_020122 [Haemaphysalis longicornis]|uniref:Uncharacterized protein n=1 Tax=Haemaphysalis longicornis TaxID=44386 RepID=A0A9J6FNS0_HAELO|nr:hypothetical protein HPB48_020122 [Haemaphysalis longicornis]
MAFVKSCGESKETLRRYKTAREEEFEDCYESRLLIQKVESDDSRKFTLFVDNAKGKASHSVTLEVKEPLALTMVIAIAVGGAVFLIVFLTLFIYLVRSEKMCFRRTKPNSKKLQHMQHVDNYKVPLGNNL